MNIPRLALKEMTTELLFHEIVTAVPAAYDAAVFAAYYHRNDLRGPRGKVARDPYIAHPYRVALRNIRWGISDELTAIGGCLHDVFEDHAQDIERETGVRADKHLINTFGTEAWNLVEQLSNPPGRQTPEEYRSKVVSRWGNIRVFAVKNSDLKDNALSLRHTPGPRRGRLARKYEPLAEPAMERLRQPDALEFYGAYGQEQALLAWENGLPLLRLYTQEREA